jgi:hypothetical protein
MSGPHPRRCLKLATNACTVPLVASSERFCYHRSIGLQCLHAHLLRTPFVSRGIILSGWFAQRYMTTDHNTGLIDQLHGPASGHPHSLNFDSGLLPISASRTWNFQYPFRANVHPCIATTAVQAYKKERWALLHYTLLHFSARLRSGSQGLCYPKRFKIALWTHRFLAEAMQCARGESRHFFPSRCK